MPRLRRLRRRHDGRVAGRERGAHPRPPAADLAHAVRQRRARGRRSRRRVVPRGRRQRRARAGDQRCRVDRAPGGSTRPVPGRLRGPGGSHRPDAGRPPLAGRRAGRRPGDPAARAALDRRAGHRRVREGLGAAGAGGGGRGRGRRPAPGAAARAAGRRARVGGAVRRGARPSSGSARAGRLAARPALRRPRPRGGARGSRHRELRRRRRRHGRVRARRWRVRAVPRAGGGARRGGPRR